MANKLYWVKLITAHCPLCLGGYQMSLFLIVHQYIRPDVEKAAVKFHLVNRAPGCLDQELLAGLV